MRRTWSAGLLAAACALLLTLPALAAEPESPGFYGLTVESGYSGITRTVRDGEGIQVEPVGADIDGSVIFYPGGVKLELTFPNLTDGKHYLLRVQREAGVPTQDNLVYVDQQTANDGAVTFTVYPDRWEKGTYYVYLTGNDGVERESLALTFCYFTPYVLGDADDDGELSAKDALWALQYVGGNRSLTDRQYLAADADRDGELSAKDALYILQAVGGTRVLTK